MDSSNNHEFIDGQSITGRNLLYEAVYDIIGEGLQMDSNIDMQGYKIINLGTPTSDQDATNKAYVDAQISGGGALRPLNEIASIYPTDGNIDMSGYKLTELTNGSLTTDSITYGQLQTEATTRATNDTNLQNQIDQEITDREAADTDLQTQITTQSNKTLAEISIANPNMSDVQMNFTKLTQLTDGADAQDAVTFVQLSNVQTNLQDQIDNIVVDSTNLIINSDIDLGDTYKIKNALDGTDDQDYVTKNQMDTADSNLQTQIDDRPTFDYISDNYYTKTAVDTKDLLLSTEISTATANMMKYTPTIGSVERFAGGLGNCYCAPVPYPDAVLGQTYDRIYNLPQIDLDSDSNLEKSQPLSGEQFNGWRYYWSGAITDLQDADAELQTQIDGKLELTTTLNNIALPNGDINANGYKITSVWCDEIDTAGSQDAVNIAVLKTFRTSQQAITDDLQNQIDLKYENNTPLNQITLADDNVDLNNNRIINVSMPVDDNDCCNKAYADSIVSGATSSIPVGTIIAWYSNSIPSGWLLCDGSSFSSTTYPDLFAILGSTTLPDFRGYFLRGRDASGIVDSTRAIGDIQTSSNLAHTHTGTTDNNSANHLHTYTRYNTLINNVSQAGLNDNVWQGTSTQNTSSTGIHNHTFTTGASGGTESRPINKAINYIIRAEITGSSQVSGYNIPAIQNWDFSNLYKPINVIDPTNPQDCVTLNYLETNYTDTSDLPTAIQTTGDSRYYLNTTTLNSITAPAGSLSLNSQKITNLANATADSDGLNRITADGRYYLSTTPLNSITLPTGNLNMNSKNIVGVLDPTASQHCATKNYVDTQISAITTPSSLNNGTYSLAWSSNNLKLKEISASQQLFDFDANDTTLSSTFYSNTHDYVSNSDASYLIRNSKTRNHFVMPTIFADLTTNVNANSASTNANTAQLYIGSNSSKTYALRVTSVGQDVEFQCKDLYLFGETSVQIGGNDLFSIGSEQVSMGGYLDINGEDIDGYSLNSYWKIRATSFDLWVPVSHKRFKKDIFLINPDELDNISFCRFKWNKQEIASVDEKTSNRIKEDDEQFGIIIEDNDIPDRYYKKSELLGYKTVDLQRLKDDMLQYCIKKIRDQEQIIKQQQEQINQILDRLQRAGL